MGPWRLEQTKKKTPRVFKRIETSGHALDTGQPGGPFVGRDTNRSAPKPSLASRVRLKLTFVINSYSPPEDSQVSPALCLAWPQLLTYGQQTPLHSWTKLA